MLIFYSQIVSELLPHRLLFLDGEVAGERLETDEGAGGVSEEAAERAAEERRQSARSHKKEMKQEKKVKRRDRKLADIIQSFIHGSAQDDRMAILLSRLFQRNTPASILLAVISLNYSEVVDLLDDYLENEQDILPDDIPQESPESDTITLVQYGKELSQALSVWTRRIFTHASFRPMKAIIALAHQHGVDHNMIQLTSLMIQRYFTDFNQEIDFDRIKEFSNLFWKDSLKKLHKLADERGILPDPTKDPLADIDEDDVDDEA